MNDLNRITEMGTNNQKVDFDAALVYLMTELDSIDGGYLSQSQRTAQYKRVAAKVINTYLKGGDNFKDDNKLKNSTLNKYLTKLRTAIRAANYRHHSLMTGASRGWTTTDKETGKTSHYVTLAKLMHDYPEQSQALESLRNEPALTIRKKVKEIAANVISSEFPTKRERELFKLITTSLKVEHEILFHLALDSAQKSKVKEQQGKALERKQHDSVTINRHAVMNMIREGLESKSIYKQMYALALASGRRFIEIAKLGAFEQVADNKVLFRGQAKKRAGHVEKPYEIYTLIHASEFIEAFKRLRESEKLAAIHERIHAKREEKGTVTPDFDNAAFNSTTAISANEAAKQMMFKHGMAIKNEDTATYSNTSTDVKFKDSRAIYASICLKQWHESDAPQLDDNAFVSSLMGHDGGTAHLNYRQFRIIEADPVVADPVVADPVVADPVVADPTANKALDNLNAAFAAIENPKKSLVRCHEKVMDWAAINPNKELTQTSLDKHAKAGNRELIKGYLALLTNAIATYNAHAIKHK